MNMLTLAILPVFAFIASRFLSQYLIKNARRFKKSKKAYKERIMLHKGVVPRLGGIAVYLACIITMSFFMLFNKSLPGADAHRLIGVFFASLLIFGTGVYDDLIKRLSYKIKFIFQILSALLLVAAGHGFRSLTIPFAPNLQLGFLGPVLVILWMLLIMNAVNLIDGLDGMASGIFFITAAGFLWAALARNDYLASAILLTCMGAAAGFLSFNFYPAKIFLGDSGSLFLGFVLGLIAMDLSIKRVAFVSLSFPVLILLVPVGSVAFTFIRRVAALNNPFNPDNMHIHYRLIRAGISHRNTVIIFYMASCFFVLLGVVSYFANPKYEFVIILSALIILFCLYAWTLYFIRHKRLIKRKKYAGRNKIL